MGVVAIETMPKPITPLAAADIFILNEKSEVLLVKRADNGFWCLPGGCQNLGESPRQAAERECWEETGFRAQATALLGVYSSQCYPYVNYPHKENEFCHVVFAGKITGGKRKTSEETVDIAWFAEGELPPLSDGHGPRIARGFAHARKPDQPPHFE